MFVRTPSLLETLEQYHALNTECFVVLKPAYPFSGTLAGTPGITSTQVRMCSGVYLDVFGVHSRHVAVRRSARMRDWEDWSSVGCARAGRFMLFIDHGYTLESSRGSRQMHR